MQEKIQKIIDKLIKKYDTTNPFELCSYLDIEIFKIPLPNRGFCMHNRRIPMIFINETLDYYDKKIVCAHELGHILLHKGYNIAFFEAYTHFSTERYETEANLFAELLLEMDKDPNIA